jgi:UDP-N-acetyl-D-galactosamine dehydrogenase
MHGRKLAVIGLGYISLPVAVAFARSGVPVIGFDSDANRTKELVSGRDRTRQVPPFELELSNLSFAHSIEDPGSAWGALVAAMTDCSTMCGAISIG